MELEVEDLTKRFGGVTALSGVSLELERGEILGVIGPNGSGKTTLLNIVSGLLAPTRGVARLAGTVLTRLPPHRVARLGVARTYQNIRLFREFTVRENIEVSIAVAHSRAVARARAGAVLRQLDLMPWSERLARTLPYGVQRRLEIARAAALEPRVLLLDEPAAGLNEAESDDLMVLIQRLRDDLGCGILVIDHDMRLIMRACQRIVVLNEGRKIAEGSPSAVRHDPAVIESYLG